jgi:exonuclease SbcC
VLRLDQVETDTDDIDIHLGNQRHPIFLLDRPGSHAAGFFAASTEADYLLKMQQLLKSKIEQGKRNQKRLDAELVALQRQLDHYSPLDDLEVQINAAEALDAVILATARQLPVLTEVISRLQETRAQLHRQEQAAAALGSLKSPPALKDITGLTLLMSELTDKTSQRHRETAWSAVLADLTPPPALDPTAALESLQVQIRATQTLHTAAQTQSSLLAPLTPPPATFEVEKVQELVRTYTDTLAQSAAWRQRRTILADAAEPPHLEDTDALEGFIVQLGREQARLASLGRATRFLAGLQPPPETAALPDLEHSLTALQQAAAQVSRQQAYLTGLTVQLEKKKTEIQTYLQETGVCPLCGSPLDLDHFLENRHA